MAADQLQTARESLRLMVFPGTDMLYKVLLPLEEPFLVAKPDKAKANSVIATDKGAQPPESTATADKPVTGLPLVQEDQPAGDRIQPATDDSLGAVPTAAQEGPRPADGGAGTLTDTAGPQPAAVVEAMEAAVEQATSSAAAEDGSEEAQGMSQGDGAGAKPPAPEPPAGQTLSHETAGQEAQGGIGSLAGEGLPAAAQEDSLGMADAETHRAGSVGAPPEAAGEAGEHEKRSPSADSAEAWVAAQAAKALDDGHASVGNLGEGAKRASLQDTNVSPPQRVGEDAVQRPDAHGEQTPKPACSCHPSAILLTSWASDTEVTSVPKTSKLKHALETRSNWL